MKIEEDMDDLKKRMISEINRDGNGISANSVGVRDEPFQLCGKRVQFELVLKIVEN